ncbi:MAG TPA: hypothetical protein VF018_13970 [Acidobacteriaceae bacterium]
MRLLLLAASIAVFAGHAIAAQSAVPEALTADQIMTKVAANQDRTEAARSHYIYLQHVRMVSRKPGGKVMCEEITDSRVSPQQKESKQQLLKLDGRYWQKRQYFHYTTLQEHEDEKPKAGDPQHKEVKTEREDLEGMDIDLIENLRKNLADDKSKDGLGKGLFPLTTEQQKQYLFALKGRQTMNGRDVYHVSFRPKDKNDFDWKGEAFIDAQEFEPVVVYTEMSRKIPLAVRTLLGTNVPGLGFSVTYDREPDGVWFPLSFGTEFRIRVLFFIARDISMSLANSHFEKTHSDVRILDGVKVLENSAPTSPNTPH